MKLPQRGVGIFVLLALLLIPAVLSAQDNTAVTVVGSGTVMPLLEALVTASDTTLNAATTVTGTNAGLEQFCQGQADIAAANRTMTADENTACASSNVTYAELLLAHQIAAFVVNPTVEYTQCLTTANLNAIFAPSAQGQTTSWNQVDVNFPNTPLIAVVPSEGTSTFAALDKVVGGDRVRADADIQDSDDSIVSTVSETEGAIGVVSLAAAQAAGDAVKILQLNTNDVTGCTDPSAENAENRLYDAATDLLLYVNRASLEKPGLQDVLNSVVSDVSAAVIEEQGFTAPTTQAYETNRGVLEGTQEQRFSRGTDQFQIPVDLVGSLNIAGSASGKELVDQLIAALNAVYPGVTTTYDAQGDPAGIRRFCNGEVELIVTTAELTEEQVQNCQANNITPLPIQVGHRATVMVGNGDSPYLACLTNEQVVSVWSAASASSIATWNQVSDEFTETPVTLFAPQTGNIFSDLLLLAAGTNDPIRDDAHVNADPLYRAAAAANVEGGLALMSWQEYQSVLENNQTNIQLVSVDGGSGCVAPSEQTIGDGKYPLTDTLWLIASESALTRPEVQSFLWFTFEDQNFPLFESSGLIGLGFGDLPDVRDTLLEAFERAAAVPEATPEATSAPGAEATAEATSVVSETTPEAAPTAEVTPEATSGS